MYYYKHKVSQTALEYVISYINVNKIYNMTLNELIDNILLIARNSNVSESEHLSRV